MANHVIKRSHKDGERLSQAESWCGERIEGFYFLDANHAALACEESATLPCHECSCAIIAALESPF